MNDELQPESMAPDAEPKAKKPRAKKAAVAAKTGETSAKKLGTKAGKAKPAVKKAARAAVSAEAVALGGSAEPIEDPIGDLSDGEARFYTGAGLGTEPEAESEAEVQAYRVEAEMEAVNGTLESGEGLAAKPVEEKPQEPAGEISESGDGESESEPRPPAKLERLQKILSQAGIASRRRAEELITEGRVMVNGQVVTALGSKADPTRDHIRVDGKLLHGAERHRYFVLNKPKGYVTTASDPEGRPTVMEFVAKLGERLYPVGRLDYQSEGLLLMTNDGELANQLTRAASGVEKTYLVKVAGQLSEEDLEKLRGGVAIERGPAGSGRVKTAPARIRQVRPGDNPWYEVVLIEGRNRELRKMFSAVGHFVEKIRRVGYGPLALDVEPGKLRELTPEEAQALRMTAEGKLKPRRLKADAMLPKDAGRRAEAHPGRPRAERGMPRTQEPEFRRQARKPFPAKGGQPRPFRGERPAREPGPRFERPAFPSRPPRREREERRYDGRFEERPRGGFRPREERPVDRPRFTRPEEPRREFGRRPEREAGKPMGRTFGKGPRKDWNKGAGERPFRSEGDGQGFRGKATAGRGGQAKPGPSGRGNRGFGGKPGGAKQGGYRGGGARPGGFRSPGGPPKGKRRG